VAVEDLRLAEVANTTDPPLLAGVLYHCQQAFEKALKGYLAWRSQPNRRTHDLVELVHACEQLDASFATLDDVADLVSPYGTAFRYPPIAVGPTDLDAVEALDAARDVMSFVLARLPVAVHP
jgi:HEPN domain-containing protein